MFKKVLSLIKYNALKYIIFSLFLLIGCTHKQGIVMPYDQAFALCATDVNRYDCECKMYIRYGGGQRIIYHWEQWGGR